MAGTIVAMFFAAVLYGWKRGKEDEQMAAETKQKDLLIDVAEKRNEIHQDVARRPDGDAAKRLRENWSRD